MIRVVLGFFIVKSVNERVIGILLILEMHERFWHYLAVFELEKSGRGLNRNS